MSRIDVPSWITVERGSAPLLLVAPHGGRRHAARHPGKHKVNDLLTAEVTRELASATGATAIINASRDRNELDLNRLTQVRRDAPWFLALIADVLTALVSQHGRATVLVVHGWNVTQVACDVGVGLRSDAGRLVPVRPDTATVSAEFVAERLRPLQRAAEAAGIAVTVGSRYPAAHPNNLLQAFRQAARADADGPLAALCVGGAIEAAQLELAIPLRWPGPRRDRFVALLAATFGTGAAAAAAGIDAAHDATPVVRGGRVTCRRGLQFVAGDLMVLTSIDAGDAGALGGRLLISTAADHLALFTGELSDPETRWTVPPLAYRELGDGGLAVTYDGVLIGFPVLTPFLDLEGGLAQGALVEARVTLAFEPQGHARGRRSEEIIGRVHGDVVLAGVHHAVDATAVATTIERFAPPCLPGLRLTLPASPLGPLTLAADPERPLVRRERRRLGGELTGIGALANGAASTVRAGCELEWSADTGSIVLTVDGAELAAARLERLIPVRRPGRDDTVIEATYALVRFRTGEVGWAEITVVADQHGTPTEPGSAVSAD